MALVCAQCSRVNPSEAAYCFFDGASLVGRGDGPLNAGSAQFASPFVYPDGTSCRNFDQLALAAQHQWQTTADLLKRGFLGKFFGNIGRLDLAMAAEDIANYPDADRGLDQLLAKLPTQALQPPKLQVEPTEINLGVLEVGADRTVEVHLANAGMRLLYGSIVSDCNWLALGEAPGQPEKIFQFGAETVVVVQVIGKHLRAGTKRLEGRLTVESNGGTATVLVHAEIPVKPFPDGLFEGARTPRQIAEKAKAQPKETAPYFENGKVAEWYASNGWSYPVQGPTMSGMGAIQQFFEALGVAKAPKVDVLPKTMQLQADPGQILQANLTISTQERKLAYGWVLPSEPWIEAGATQLSGKSASIPLTLRVPQRPGRRVEAKLQVQGNGTQKFTIPVSVAISGTPVEEPPEPELQPVVMLAEDGASPFAGLDAPVMELSPLSADPAPPPAASPEPTPRDRTSGPKTPPPSRANPDVKPAAPERPLELDLTIRRPTVKSTAPRIPRLPPFVHVIPLVFLVLTLSGIIIRDVFTEASAVAAISGDIKVDPNPRVKIGFDFGVKKINNNVSFGLVQVDPADKSVHKRLTFGELGHTNSVVLKIDDKERGPGESAYGVFEGKPEEVGKGGLKYVFKFKENIWLTQHVELVLGEPSKVSLTEHMRFYDTCLARYKIENKDKRAHKVGIRYLLDTCIGDGDKNDAVPFTLPGLKTPIKKAKEFTDTVPDFVQVLEREDLKNPGVVAQLNLRISNNLEMPERLSLTRFPGTERKFKDKYEVPSVDPGNDSALVMYWSVEEMKPGSSREMGFTYGIGNVAAGSSKLGLTAGGAFFVGGQMTVVGTVADPQVKSVKLELPKELELIDAKSQQQTVGALEKGPGGVVVPATLTWRVRSKASGTFTLQMLTDDRARVERVVQIAPKSLF